MKLNSSSDTVLKMESREDNCQGRVVAVNVAALIADSWSDVGLVPAVSLQALYRDYSKEINPSKPLIF